MRVKLLHPHIIAGVWYPTGRELALPVGTSPTVLMEGLDDEAVKAITREKVRVFGRRIRRDRLLDDPPIERPNFDNAQPVPPIQRGGPR